MKPEVTVSEVFNRFDLHLESSRQQARQVSSDDLLQKVADCLILGNEDEIEDVVNCALVSRQPLEVINDGLIRGMREVSRLWAEGDFFLPQVILSSDAMVTGIALCEKQMKSSLKRKGKVITHTAEGDIHDIGQVIVNALLTASGFEVVDLGADVPVDDVVDACQYNRPLMLTGTALMTTTMTAFPAIASKLQRNKLDIPFVCGGGAVNAEFMNAFDLGIWGQEASQAPTMAEDVLGGMGWQEMRRKWNQ